MNWAWSLRKPVAANPQRARIGGDAHDSLSSNGFCLVELLAVVASTLVPSRISEGTAFVGFAET